MNTDTSLINQDFTVEELFGRVYDSMNDLVHYLAIQYSEGTPEVLMEKDELVGELYMELWKGTCYYHKRHLPEEQMRAVLKVMLSNRIAELRYRYFRTHRAVSQVNISIDITIDGVFSSESMDDYDPFQDLVSGYGGDPADLFDSAENVQCIRSRLTVNARQVFDAVVYGNEQLALHIWLSAVRSNNVYKTDRNVKMKPWHLASALCIPEQEAVASINEIKHVVEEVYCEY